MTVKRYNYGFGLLLETEGDGMYVLHSDYASLLTRHNALMEAVAGMFAAQDAWAQKGGASYPDWADGRARYDAARAEVDRLIANEGADDCKGEG